MALKIVRIFARLASLLLLAGCAGSGVGQAAPESVRMSARVMAECRMLERAFRETQKLTGSKNYAIVQGCPGYENRRVSRGVFSGAGSFLSMSGASIPAKVTARGAAAIRLYRRMIARGTPAGVAQKISDSPEFKVAVNVANQSGQLHEIL